MTLGKETDDLRSGSGSEPIIVHCRSDDATRVSVRTRVVDFETNT